VTSFRGEQTAQALQGVWAVDLGELEALKTSVLTVKNFVSLQRDRYKPPYGKHYIWRPRRMVFVGDTNEDEFLRDPTGARRFWPFECYGVDIDLLARNRDQLWAEAVRALEDGEQWWIDRGTPIDTLAAEVQKASFKEDAWAGRIDAYLDQPDVMNRQVVLIDEIERHLNLDPNRIDETSEGRIIGHLRHLGWHKHKCLRHGQNRNWWFPPDAPYEPRMGRPRGE
jgi:predicted P-loop ATPase